MAHKRDRRRRERAKGHQRQQAGRRQRERQLGEAIRRVFGAALKDLSGLGDEPDEFVRYLAEALGDETLAAVLGHPTSAHLGGWEVAENLGAERAALLATSVAAGAMRTATDPASSEAMLWWAVGLYDGAKDPDAAERTAWAALDRPTIQAADQTRGPGDASSRDEQGRQIETSGATEETDWAMNLIARLRLRAGRTIDAATLALAQCENDPDDEEAVELFSQALEQVWRSKADGPDGDALLERFADRSLVRRLAPAMIDFLGQEPGVALWAAQAQEEWKAQLLDALGLDEWDAVAGQSPFAVDGSAGNDASGALDLLTLESIWSRGPSLDAADAKLADREDDDAGSLLNRFADNPASAPELAELARRWADGGRWGLWQVADPTASPGLWVTDLVTGRRLYVSMAPHQLEDLPRWGVLAGCFLPDRGIWRGGSSFALLSPAEGDRAAETARTLGVNFAGAFAAEQNVKGAKRLLAAEPKLGDVPAHGALAGLGETMGAEAADMFSKVTGVALATVVGTGWQGRGRPPRLVNTDQEPIELFQVTAQIPDPEALCRALERRSDFERGGDGSTFHWRGRTMTPLEAETSWSEFRRIAHEKGLRPGERPEGPQEYLRGVLHIEGSVLTVDVNSRGRLQKLTQLLGKLGVPEPVVQRRFDPALDMAVPLGWRPLPEAGSDESEAVWREHWLDETVPALGTTPREAVESAKTAVKLERLLRQFEFDADLARFAGKRPMDVDAIRAALADEEGDPFSF